VSETIGASWAGAGVGFDAHVAACFDRGKYLPGGFNLRRGHFQQPESSKELVDVLEEMSSPVSAFLREQCVIEPGRQVPVRDLFQRWQAWCQATGRDYPGSVQTLGRDLHSLVPALRQIRTNSEGARERIYRGIGLR
jgi:putative DNA primase/helicase